MTTLGDEFPLEIERAKEKAEGYRGIGAAGAFALSWITPLIAEAEQAQASGDVVAMVRLYPQLKDIAW